jgi:hypothetical protein
MFSDPWNPSSAEVRQWAYTLDADEPCQDWDLALSWAAHEREYIEFAADQECPSRKYFLRLLYFIIGDAVRNNFRTVSEARSRSFVEFGRKTASPEVRLWCERSLDLLKNPEGFEYSAWCGGGLANDAAT